MTDNNGSVKLITQEEYSVILKENQHIINNLLNIIKQSDSLFEGNSFYYHLSYEPLKSNNKQLNLYSVAKNANNILEIGFNGGHSCLLFLLANPHSKIDCFDICLNGYVKDCFNYLSSVFPDRLRLIEGDSMQTIPAFIRNNLDKTYDLLHIDGNHAFEYANQDFINTRHFRKMTDNINEKTIVIFDDTNISYIDMLWKEYIKLGYVIEIPIYPVIDYPHSIGRLL